MAKQLHEIKAAANEVAKRAKLGQIDERALIGVVNDLVNHLHAKEAGSPVTTAVAPPAAQVPAPVAKPEVAPTVSEAASAKKAVRVPKGIKVGNQAPVTPEVTVGNPVPEVKPAPAPKPSGTTTTSIPHNVKVGRGVTVGTKPNIHTGVTVGSAPVNPAGLVTVGGRPRKV